MNSEPKLKTFTIFCADRIRSHLTMHISTHEAPNADAAAAMGKAEAAEELECDLEDAWVVGVAEGEVQIVSWDA